MVQLFTGFSMHDENLFQGTKALNTCYFDLPV